MTESNLIKIPSSYPTMNIDPPSRNHSQQFQEFPSERNVRGNPTYGVRKFSDISASSYNFSREVVHPVNEQNPSDIFRKRFSAVFLNKVFSKLGSFQYHYRLKVIGVCLLILSLSCLGLKKIKIEADIESLWMQDNGRVKKEREILSQFGENENSRGSAESIIQTGKNMLSVQALEEHLQVLMRIKNLVIHHADRNWKLKDICRKPHVPYFGNEFIQNYVRQFMPCIIWTPLDCFWDASKVLDNGGLRVSIPQTKFVYWKSVDPMKLMKEFEHIFHLSGMGTFMKEVGISHGYLDRPCLDPHDPECPKEAPNFKKRSPNVTHELRNGCSGFATELMHYPLEVLLGGVQKENFQLKSAKSLQSLVFFKSPRELVHEYSRYNSQLTDKLTEEVVQIFQQKIKSELMKCNDPKNNLVCHGMKSEFYSLGDDELKSTLSKVTESSLTIQNIIIVILLLAVFSGLCFCRWGQSIISHVWLCLAGLILVILSILCGLSISAFLEIRFHAITYQVLPFLLLGMGLDNIFLFTFHYSNLVQYNLKKDVICDTVRNCGPSILYTALCEVTVFFLSGAIIDVPLIRTLCLQVGLITSIQTISTIFIYPSFLSMDLVRRKNLRVDLFCCLSNPFSHRETLPTPSNTNIGIDPETSISIISDKRIPNSVSDGGATSWNESSNALINTASSSDYQIQPGTSSQTYNSHCNSAVRQNISGLNSTYNRRVSGEDVVPSEQHLTTKLTNYLVNFLSQTSVKICVCIVWIALLAVPIYGLMKMQRGVPIASILPSDSIEQKFVTTFSSDFGIYTIDIFTYEMDYSLRQPDLIKFHKELKQLPQLLHFNDQVFWLDAFREWTKTVQEAYREDLKLKRINSNCSYNEGVSTKGVIARELLRRDHSESCDPDRMDHQIIYHEGIINQNSFYQYLTIWYSLDMTHRVIASEIHPEPRVTVNPYQPYNTTIGRRNLKNLVANAAVAEQLRFVKTSLVFTGINNSSKMIEISKKVRDITDKYRENGLKNIPRSLLLVLCDQFLNLDSYIWKTLTIGFFACIVISFLFISTSSTIVGLFCSIWTLFQINGLMCLIGYEFNMISVMLLTLSLAFIMRYQGCFIMAFHNTSGKCPRKCTEEALRSCAASIMLSGLASLLAVAMLANTNFHIINIYFFQCVELIIFMAMTNGLIFVPTIFSLVPLKVEEAHHREECESNSRESSQNYAELPQQVNTVPVPITREARKRSKRSPSISHSRPASLSTISEEPSHLGSNPSIISANEPQFQANNFGRMPPAQGQPQRRDNSENRSHRGFEYAPKSHYPSPQHPVDDSHNISSHPSHPSQLCNQCCPPNPTTPFTTTSIKSAPHDSIHYNNYPSSTTIRATAQLDVEVFNHFYPEQSLIPRVHYRVDKPCVTTHVEPHSNPMPNCHSHAPPSHSTINETVSMPLASAQSQSAQAASNGSEARIPNPVNNSSQHGGGGSQDNEPPPYPGV